MKQLIAGLTFAAITVSTAAQAQPNVEQLIKAAQKEGQVYSVGMPDGWANWKDTWADMASTYGLKHQDTDMSSAQEIAKFAAEKKCDRRYWRCGFCVWSSRGEERGNSTL